MGREPLPVYVELTAVLERTLAFAHTGNMRMLTRSLMDRLWLSKGLVDQGFPALSDILHLAGSYGNDPVITVDKWPRHPRTGIPLVASERAQALTFGVPHFNVSSPRSYLLVIILGHNPHAEYVHMITVFLSVTSRTVPQSAHRLYSLPCSSLRVM